MEIKIGDLYHNKFGDKFFVFKKEINLAKVELIFYAYEGGITYTTLEKFLKLIINKGR